jgi:hypothetical protein
MSDYNETLRRWQSTPLTVEHIESLPVDELDDWLWIRLCARSVHRRVHQSVPSPFLSAPTTRRACSSGKS